MKSMIGMVTAAVLVVGASGVSASASELRDEALENFKPIPNSLPGLSAEQVELGRMLYFDPRLSASQLISCNTCHNLGMGGDDNLETSVGHGWATGPRNAPTVLNAVFNAAQFWDGRAADLMEQAKGPVQAGVEMNNTPERVVATLNSIPEYVAHFAAAFPGQDDPVSFDNMATAIEAFESTLITPASRFDQYLNGQESALNPQEQKGLALFMEKGCGSCHNGVNFGGQDYFQFGVFAAPSDEVRPRDDKGRAAVTGEDADFTFRAAPLRNVALTAPYFHSGTVWNLGEAVRIMAKSQLGEDLSKEETDAIVAFLHTLTGAQPRVVYPTLPSSGPNTPKPVIKAGNGKH